MQLRGVLFDLDDTLIDHRGAVARALAAWLPDLPDVAATATTSTCSPPAAPACTPSTWTVTTRARTTSPTGSPPCAISQRRDQAVLDVEAGRAAADRPIPAPAAVARMVGR